MFEIGDIIQHQNGNIYQIDRFLGGLTIVRLFDININEFNHYFAVDDEFVKLCHLYEENL